MQRSVDVIVEIPKGSRSKYELDKATGRLRLDRVLHSSVHYPADYGFIPDTLAQDGDPLDAIVVVEEPSVPGSIQSVRPIAVLHMSDRRKPDEKILAVPLGDPRFAQVRRLDDLPAHWRVEIATFFDTYKKLEAGEDPVVRGWGGTREAWAAIAAARASFSERQGAASAGAGARGRARPRSRRARATR